MPFEDGAATPEEIREFCNEVRAAGGIEPLEHLMPSVPANAQSCLVARNLNFDCLVRNTGQKNWYMYLIDKHDLAEDIASQLNLHVTHKQGNFEYLSEIELPSHIGYAARLFDRYDERYGEYYDSMMEG